MEDRIAIVVVPLSSTRPYVAVDQSGRERERGRREGEREREEAGGLREATRMETGEREDKDFPPQGTLPISSDDDESKAKCRKDKRWATQYWKYWKLG